MQSSGRVDEGGHKSGFGALRERSELLDNEPRYREQRKEPEEQRGLLLLVPAGFADKKMACDGRQQASASFFMMLAKSDIQRIAIENPICIMSSLYRKPDQVIQPWMFGHGETKATSLWLKGLPKLIPTNLVDGREQRIHKMPPSADRWKVRSITYQGIAQAMADQWGSV